MSSHVRIAPNFYVELCGLACININNSTGTISILFTSINSIYNLNKFFDEVSHYNVQNNEFKLFEKIIDNIKIEVQMEKFNVGPSQTEVHVNIVFNTENFIINLGIGNYKDFKKLINYFSEEIINQTGVLES